MVSWPHWLITFEDGRHARHSPEPDIVALDGVYAIGGNERPEFHELPAPDDEEIIELTPQAPKRAAAAAMSRVGGGNKPAP